jgi:ribosomal protein L14
LFNLLLQKGSFFIPADKGNIIILKTIQIYNTRKKKLAILGKFIKAVIKRVTPKFRRYRKAKTRAIIIRSNIFLYKKDNTSIRFIKNGVVPIKRRMNP